MSIETVSLVTPQPLPQLATQPPPDAATSAATLDVAEFVAWLTHERGLSRNTQLAYGRDLRLFAAWVKAGGLACLLQPTAAELDFLVEYLRDRELSAVSINRALTAVKTFYRFLHLRGRVSAATLTNVLLTEGPAEWERLPVVLDPEQATQLVEAPVSCDGRYYLRDRAILETMYATGCRASEMCDLLLANLHLSEASAEVIGKGGKSRIVLLNRPAVAALTAYLGELRPRLVRKSPDALWVFVSRSGCRLTREMVWILVKKYVRLAGLPSRASPHTVRHSVATHLMLGGADLLVIGEVLGHSKIGTTMKYTHVDEKRMRELHRLYHPRGSTPPEPAAPGVA